MCEEKLSGGRVTASVVKVGDTVHRTPCANSAFVRRALGYLSGKGADFAPRYLGADEQGREVFSFMPGQVPDNIGEFTDEQCCAAACMIARLHLLACDMPGCTSRQTLCHGDLSPCNFTFERGMPRGIIDWDAAAIGEPIVDLAYAIWMWLDIGNDELDAHHVSRRMGLMMGAYEGELARARRIDSALALSESDISRESLLEAMLSEMARVGSSIFPTEEQTRATSAWAHGCARWCGENAGELLAGI